MRPNAADRALIRSSAKDRVRWLRGQRGCLSHTVTEIECEFVDCFFPEYPENGSGFVSMYTLSYYRTIHL